MKATTAYPITILWPADTITQLAGSVTHTDLNTGGVKVTYHSRDELERAVYNLGIVKQAKKLGGVVSVEEIIKVRGERDGLSR